MSKNGFTLLELLVAIGIFVLISLSAAWFVIHGFRYNKIIWDQLLTQSEGRKVLQQVVDAVRKAEESSIGGYSIATAQDYELIVYANMDEDGYKERVRFWLDGTTLKRGIIKPSGNPLQYQSSAEAVVEIAHSVVNIARNTPLFLYYNQDYDGSGAPLSQPVATGEIRVVRVQMELEENPDESPVPLYVSSLVSIRNLKDN